MGEIFSLDNKIQHYAWGSYETLALMRGLPAPSQEPEAELWVGAHASAPSVAHLDGGAYPLDQLVGEQPGRFLNSERKHDVFPFLFKVLAIESPLSIQVHPTDEQAAAGFEEENARGVALDDPSRNYKDRFSKPETVIALSPMRILTGVREFAELRALADLFSLDWLAGVVAASKTPKQLLTAIIRLPQEAADAAVKKTVKAAQKWAKKHGPVPGAESVAAGAVELILLVNDKYPGDRGLLVALAMNLAYLNPGDSAFTPDGQVHAYVSGTAIELMNPSDNVMRAGLTPKHIDEEELIKVLGENQGAPVIQRPRPVGPAASEYAMWDERLTVTRVVVEEGTSVDYLLEGVSTALCVAGTVVVSDGEKSFTLKGTESVMHVGSPTAVTLSGAGELYIAAQR